MSTPVRAVLVVALLYLFLTGVELLGGGFKNLGNDLVDGLFEGVSNPIGGPTVHHYLLQQLGSRWSLTHTGSTEYL